MRILVIAATILATSMPVLADEVSGKILAYDRLANVIVLDDKTVWEMGSTTVPADLAAGDMIKITYEGAGEDGVSAIDSLERM